MPHCLLQCTVQNNEKKSCDKEGKEMSRQEISVSDNMSRFLTGFAAVMAVLLLTLMLFYNLVKVFNVEGISAEALDIISSIIDYMTAAVVIIVGLQASIKQGFVAFLLFIIVAAAVVILMFFGTFAKELFN